MASYTENLELLKKDPMTEGTDNFNIRTMMNDNWDKIDRFAGTKGEAEGLAELDENGKVPEEQMPAMGYEPAGAVNTHNSSGTAHSDIRTALAGKAPAYQYSTTDLTAGTSPLATGTLYFVYE